MNRHRIFFARQGGVTITITRNKCIKRKYGSDFLFLLFHHVITTVAAVFHSDLLGGYGVSFLFFTDAPDHSYKYHMLRTRVTNCCGCLEDAFFLVVLWSCHSLVLINSLRLLFVCTQ